MRGFAQIYRFKNQADAIKRIFDGGVAEWLNAPVLKTDVGESLPWVRIPPPPPYE